MTKNHLKRLNVPTTWNVNKHANVFVTRPNPGGHPMDMALPLVVVVRDILGVATTKKELVTILQRGDVLIDGRVVKSPAAQIGFLDVLSFKSSGKHYRITLNTQGKLGASEISADEAKKLALRVEGKTLRRGGKVQLNLFGGKNLLVDKDTYRVGDTVLVDSEKNTIAGHFKYDKGMRAILTGGQHIGTLGTIEDIKDNNIIYKNNDGEVFETLKQYAYIVGDSKEAITIK